MKKIVFITSFILLALASTCFGADTKASRIRVDTAQFSNNLSSGATDVQKALDEIDNLSVIGESNTASNVGTAGMGVFKQKIGADLEFYKLNSTNALLTIGLDGLNKIDFTINEGNFNLGNIGGAVTDAQVPDNITINNAATADALSANGGNCLAGYVPLGVDTLGASEGCFNVTTQAEFDNHPHSAADITSGTFADDRIAQSNVTQHQAALVITESQISDLNHTVDTTLTQEQVQDFVGPMVTGNTETLITVTYNDLSNYFDFIVENDLGLFDWTNVDGVDLKVGSITQAWDADLDDLADGKLTNSKVDVIDGSQYTNFGSVTDDTIDELFAAIDANWPTGGSGEANTASNQGVGGLGLFATKVGVDLQFKNINAGSNKISVTNDAVNKEVDIDVVEANINHQNISGAGTNTHAQIDSHIADTSDPHGTTLSQTNITLAGTFKILENGASPALYGIFDVADLTTTDKMYTFPDLTGSVLLKEQIDTQAEFDALLFTLDHNALINYVAAEHIDWTLAGQGTIHTSNYVDNTDDSVSGSELDGVFSTTGLMKRTGASTYSTIPAPAGDVVGTSDTQTLTNKTLSDSSTTFQDDLDNTKKLLWQLSGITTLTTRTLTIPDENGTLCTTGSVCAGYQASFGFTPEDSANKGVASGYASLNAGSLVVQDPANATSTPTASKMPIADGSGKLDGWISLGATIEDGELPSSMADKTITGFLAIPQGTAPVVDAAGKVAIDTTDDQLVYFGAAKRVIPYEQTKCVYVENLAAADDGVSLGMFNDVVTITAVGVHCDGTCTTPATIALQDRGGTVMTHTAPTVSTGTGNTTFTSVTAANGLVAGEGLEFNVTNAVSPETDAYTVCYTYTVDAQ